MEEFFSLFKNLAVLKNIFKKWKSYYYYGIIQNFYFMRKNFTAFSLLFIFFRKNLSKFVFVYFESFRCTLLVGESIWLFFLELLSVTVKLSKTIKKHICGFKYRRINKNSCKFMTINNHFITLLKKRIKSQWLRKETWSFFPKLSILVCFMYTKLIIILRSSTSTFVWP